MQVTDIGAKHIIANLIKFEDNVDPKGKPIQRQYFKKDMLSGWRDIQDALRSSVDILIQSKDKTPQEAEWVAFSPDLKIEDDTQVLNERQTDRPIEFTDRAIAALKYFWRDRQMLPPMSEETEKIIKELVK